MAEREGEDRRRPLALARFAEQRADAAEREQLERDRLGGVCLLERYVEAPLCLVGVAERERGEADPAEGGDRAPPVVDLAERLIAGAAEPAVPPRSPPSRRR